MKTPSTPIEHDTPRGNVCARCERPIDDLLGEPCCHLCAACELETELFDRDSRSDFENEALAEFRAATGN